MRSAWWWAVLAVIATVSVASALRSPQGEAISRGGKRHSTSTADPVRNDTLENEDRPKFKSREYRTQLTNDENTPRETSRSRTRSRITTIEAAPSSSSEKKHLLRGSVEHFDSKRSNSRTQRPIIDETKLETNTKRSNDVQRKTRQRQGRLSQSRQIPTISNNNGFNKNETLPLQTSTETLLGSDVYNSQLKRRTTTIRTIENNDKNIATRSRGRLSSRKDTKALDLDISGTVNTITVIKPTTTRTGDIRNSKKLRYKTRSSEVDTNLTGEGLKEYKETNSSHTGAVTNPPEVGFSSSTPIINSENENITRKMSTSTIKSMRIVRRPLSKQNARKLKDETINSKIKKISDEISEDDNYPESFKALIQAKNASTNINSSNESLAVNPSLKVIKTFTPTPQTNYTGPDSDDWLLRNKSNNYISTTETVNRQNSIEEKILDVATENAQLIQNRSQYVTSTVNSNVVSSPSTFKPSSRRSFKSSRNIKVTTTEIPGSLNKKQFNALKKPARSLTHARRYTENDLASQNNSLIDNRNNESLIFRNNFKPKSLRRTSYYSRSRNYPNNTSNTSTTTEEYSNVKKADDKPIIFTYLTSRSKNPETVGVDEQVDTNEKPKKPFIVTFTSKESLENLTQVKLNISENTTIESFGATTQRYHATYKDNKFNATADTDLKMSIIPPIRNIRTRKYNRKNEKTRKSGSPVIISTRSKERSSKKYSDTYSKTTESSSNGITPEIEKSKQKFSSKYRASVIDKPFYKPTVPTITSSTAWLKFFVTDPEIYKSVEEPNWFEEEDFVGVTTEQMSRQIFTSSKFVPETSVNMVNKII